MSRINGRVQTRELGEHAISKEFHDPAAFFSYKLPGDTLEALDHREREVLIVRRQRRIPCHIREKDCSEATFTAQGRGWSLRSQILGRQILVRQIPGRRIVRWWSVRWFGHRFTLR
jgi:hypothetical protein